MNYTKVDLNRWVRKEHFEHYRHQVQCTFSLTTEIDITHLLSITKERKYRFYAVMIYQITKTVNQIAEFRMGLKGGELILWDCLQPSYTIFNTEKETFSGIWTEYHSEFPRFMENYLKDETLYKNSTAFSPKPNLPENYLNISSLPWAGFTGFNLNIPNVKDYFHPIFTIGKYIEKEGKVFLPLAIQVHHAVCDGFHVCKFINLLQNLCNDFE